MFEEKPLHEFQKWAADIYDHDAPLFAHELLAEDPINITSDAISAALECQAAMQIFALNYQWPRYQSFMPILSQNDVSEGAKEAVAFTESFVNEIRPLMKEENLNDEIIMKKLGRLSHTRAYAGMLLCDAMDKLAELGFKNSAKKIEDFHCAEVYDVNHTEDQYPRDEALSRAQKIFKPDQGKHEETSNEENKHMLEIARQFRKIHPGAHLE